MPPQGDINMAKALQAEFSNGGSSSRRPIRPGRARRENPPITLPRTQQPPASCDKPAKSYHRSTTLPSAWCGPLLTPADLANNISRSAISLADQPASETTFSFGNGPEENPNSSGYQTVQATSSFVGQLPTQQPLQTQTNMVPVQALAPVQFGNVQPLSITAIKQIPDGSQQKRKLAPSSSNAMSVDEDPLPSKLNAFELEMLEKWNPGLSFSSNGKHPKENVPFLSTASHTNQGPSKTIATNGMMTGSDPSSGIVTSGMVSGAGLSKSRWA